MGRGKDYENEIAKQLYRGSDSLVRVYTAGYSGNNAIPQPDIHVFHNGTTMAHDMELKHAQSDYCYVDEEDLQQLAECRAPNTRVWLVVKFSNRAPLAVPLVDSRDRDFDSLAAQFAYIIDNATDSSFDARATESDTLAITKPDTDGWQSAQASAADYLEIAKQMGLPLNGDDTDD